jgi:DNA-binding transcriptional LysR family regulator
MLDSVSKGVGDLAIGVKPQRWTGQVVELGWEHFVAILSPEDPLSFSMAPIDLGALADRHWVLFEPSNGLADYVFIACAQAGFRPREAVLTSQVQVAINLAVAGLGVALVPSMNVAAQLSHAKYSLTRSFVWPLAAFSRAEFSRPASKFVELLKSVEWPELPEHATILPGD